MVFFSVFFFLQNFDFDKSYGDFILYVCELRCADFFFENLKFQKNETWVLISICASARRLRASDHVGLGSCPEGKSEVQEGSPGHSRLRRNSVVAHQTILSQIKTIWSLVWWLSLSDPTCRQIISHFQHIRNNEFEYKIIIHSCTAFAKGMGNWKSTSRVPATAPANYTRKKVQ